MIEVKKLNHLLIFGAVILTTYAQLIIKWRMSNNAKVTSGVLEKFIFLISMLFDPWVLSAIIGAFIGGLAWMAAMTKFELSYAYPFVSLSFVLVLLMSNIFFNEPLTPYKVIGVILIVAGVIVGSQK